MRVGVGLPLGARLKCPVLQFPDCTNGLQPAGKEAEGPGRGVCGVNRLPSMILSRLSRGCFLDGSSLPLLSISP